MYNSCQKRATSAVKQFPFVLHWHVDMQGFTFLFLESSFDFHWNHLISRRAYQPNQSNHQRRPDCREVSSETMTGCKDQASKVAEALGLVTCGVKLSVATWGRPPWNMTNRIFSATCWTVCLDDWQWEGSLTC